MNFSLSLAMIPPPGDLSRRQPEASGRTDRLGGVPLPGFPRGRGGQAGDYRDLALTAGPSERSVVRQQAVSFINYNNWLYFSSKSIIINQIGQSWFLLITDC